MFHHSPKSLWRYVRVRMNDSVRAVTSFSLETMHGRKAQISGSA